MDSRNIPPHERACPDNPVVREALALALADPNCPGYACSTRSYVNRRVFYSAPSIDVLILRYKSWDVVCAEFGLIAPITGPNGKRTGAGTHPFAVCPHCGVKFRSSALGNHERTCPSREDLRAAIIALAEHPDMPGMAVSSAVYTERSQGYAVPSRRTLELHFGTWHKAMLHFGLATQRNQEEIERRIMAEIQEERENVRRILRTEREGAYGLAVLAVLPAPGLTVNGRECVRLVLR
jgi:hypothetical protein